MSEEKHTPKYKVLYNRLTCSTPFAASTAIADALEITQDEAAELTAIAQERGTTSATVEERLAAVEAHQLELDEAVMELATCISYRNAAGEIVNCDHEAIGNAAFAFVGTSGVQMGWLASQADMLADDWQEATDNG